MKSLRQLGQRLADRSGRVPVLQANPQALQDRLERCRWNHQHGARLSQEPRSKLRTGAEDPSPASAADR